MDAFDRIAKRTPSRTRRRVAKMLDVADRIQAVLEQKGMSQEERIAALKKVEANKKGR